MKSIHLGKKKIVELTINDVEYIAALDNYAIDHFQKHNKKGLLTAIEELKDNNMTTMIQLLGSIIREKKTNKIVGVYFLKQFDTFDILNNLTPIIGELFQDNMPEASDEDEKK